MTKIKSIVFCSRKKLKNSMLKSGFELCDADFPPYFFDFVHHLMPLRLKFLNESFVAYDNKGILGLISLEKDEKSSKRLKITKLFLEKNSYDIGKILVQYAISRYCAMGATSYVVTIENNCEDLLSLFVKGCSFSQNADEYIFNLKSENADKFLEFCEEGFSFFKPQSAPQVCKLYNSNINSYQRHNFICSKEQFMPSFASGLSEKIQFSYVLQDEQEGKVYGYFRIDTKNNVDYTLNFVIERGYEIYFKDALGFISNILSRRCKNWNLYIKVKSFFVNYDYFKSFLFDMELPLVKTSKILTKDYLTKAREINFISSAKIIFNDITPAFKSGHEIVN